MKFHDHRCITKSVMVWKPFSITNTTGPWPFDLKINRAHPWLMRSKCMKFHYYISNGIWLTVRKPINDTCSPACPPNSIPYIRLRAEFCNLAKINGEYGHLVKYDSLSYIIFSRKKNRQMFAWKSVQVHNVFEVVQTYWNCVKFQN